MRRSSRQRTIVWAGALALASCGACGPGTILAIVEIDSAAQTDCVRVGVWSDVADVHYSQMIPRDGGDKLQVGVFPGNGLGDSIWLQAYSYQGATCQTLNEQSPIKTQEFIKDRQRTVTLSLRGTNCAEAAEGAACPGGFCRAGKCIPVELNCNDGLDNNSDNLVDCADPSCLNAACSAGICAIGATCQPNGTCAGQPRVCTPPDQCYLSICVGAIDAGCVDAVRTGSCDDKLACTTADTCHPGGVCSGTVTCPPSPEPCVLSGCVVGGGCGYTVDAGATCATGAHCAIPSGRCTAFAYAPSNFDPGAVWGAPAVQPLVIDCAAVLNTTDGGFTWCPGQPAPTLAVVSQTNGPQVAVLRTSSLYIADAGSLRAIGVRPLVVAVYGDAVIDGVIDGRSRRAFNVGAGGNSTDCAAAATAANTNNPSVLATGGGGGGGFGSLGGRGGNSANGGTLGADGGGVSGTPQLIPLRGGCTGGAGGISGVGGGSPANPGRGGAGGGAIQLSVAGQLVVRGVVAAGGAGGDGGQCDQGNSNGAGGGGGGSGGAVLLEANALSLWPTSALTAPGGAGGEGGDQDLGSNEFGFPGEDGRLASSLPALGLDGVSTGGVGGRGGALGNIAADGGYGLAGEDHGGGGGGGAVGRIRLNAIQTCWLDAGVMSPAPTYGGVCF